MSEVRKKILDALDCIPDALDAPEALLNIYQNDQTLARKAAELYMALLEAIEGMLDWLDHKAYSKPKPYLICINRYEADFTTTQRR